MESDGNAVLVFEEEEDVDVVAVAVFRLVGSSRSILVESAGAAVVVVVVRGGGGGGDLGRETLGVRGATSCLTLEEEDDFFLWW